MKAILQHKRSKRLFGILTITLLALIFIVRVFVLKTYPNPDIPEPVWHALVARLLDSIFVSLFVGYSVGLFILYLEGPDEAKKFDIIESSRLEELFDTEMSQSTIWSFTGGMGRHTRSKTIPYFDKTSKSSNQHKTISISIIDPANETVCQSYANYRRNLRSAKSKKNLWTKSYVQTEIISTIIVAALYKRSNSLLKIDVALKSTFSTLRIDLAERSAIITKEDKSEPAIVCRKGSFLYSSYKEEILQGNKLHRALNLTLTNEYVIKDITPIQVKSILAELNLDIPLVDEHLKALSQIIRKNKNPYA